MVNNEECGRVRKRRPLSGVGSQPGFEPGRVRASLREDRRRHSYKYGGDGVVVVGSTFAREVEVERILVVYQQQQGAETMSVAFASEALGKVCRQGS